MPELPEVECVRLSLERLVVGRPVKAVRVIRPGVIRGQATPHALLQGDRLERVLRHGKQLALVGHTGRCVCVHLGMSGQLCVMSHSVDHESRPAPLERTNPAAGSMASPRLPAHTHVLWQLDQGQAVRFTDPRRFGGLWTFAELDQLLTRRWSTLGPDALKITPAELHRRLGATQRTLKAALLDQQLVAGLGNIYVDELLFELRLHPQQPARSIDAKLAGSMVGKMGKLLSRAIERGGSSLRDYVDAQNQPGSQQHHHRVYGRAGLPCTRRSCGAAIVSEQVAGRTTTWCPNCQPLHPTSWHA